MTIDALHSSQSVGYNNVMLPVVFFQFPSSIWPKIIEIRRWEKVRGGSKWMQVYFSAILI